MSAEGDSYQVEQEFYNDSDSDIAFNREQFVLKWLESLPSIVTLVEKYQQLDQQQEPFHYSCPSKAVKSERSAYLVRPSKMNMPCRNRSSSVHSTKPRPVCPAKPKTCPSMDTKLKQTCPAKTSKFPEYTCPSEIHEPRQCCCPKTKTICPAKVERPLCPTASTMISRREQVCPVEDARQNICPAKQPKPCPAKESKVYHAGKCKVRLSNKPSACPIKKNVCPSMQQSVYSGKQKENICSVQQQSPKVKKISKIKYSYETYKYPERNEEAYVCPVLESESETTGYYSRKSESHLYEEFSSASETDPDINEHYEEVSYIDSDEDASCLNEVGYDLYARSSGHSVSSSYM